MRKKGAQKAEKVAGRSAAEGLIGTYLHPGDKMSVLIEVNCETDYVVQTAEFKDLVKTLAVNVACNPNIRTVDSSEASGFTDEWKAKELSIQLATEDLERKPAAIKEKIA